MREYYVMKLKAQLDRWNAQMLTWESKAKVAQADAKQRIERDLDELRSRREKALCQVKLLEGASATAWNDLALGAGAECDAMSVAIARTRGHFRKH